MSHRVLPSPNGIIPADFTEQAETASRIRQLCQERFGGNRDLMARTAKVNVHTLRCLFKGKILDPDEFDSLVKRLCLLRAVDESWLRRGEGPLFLAVKAANLNGVPSKAKKEESVPAPAPAKTPHEAESFDLFKDLLAEIKLIEEQSKRSVALFEESKKDFANHRALMFKLKEAFEDRTKQLESRIEGHGIGIAEQQRRIDRLETAMLSLRSDLQALAPRLAKIEGDLLALLEAKTEPDPPNPREEELPDDRLLSTQEYFELEGDAPTQLKDSGFTGQVVSRYFELIRIVKPGQVSQKNRDLIYPVRWYRLLGKFVQANGSKPSDGGTRKFLEFLIASENP